MCPSVGPGTASDGPGERWAAHHIIRATHNGAGHVRGAGSNHYAGPCIWSPGTAAGKRSGSVKICIKTVIRYLI